eukprot:TRINITY_DN6824_c0_g2_i1.p1 TRINITY_DN6824_c0_g2~~TRINITY_DN6824_c0_g2_i1.p1  ORF type:complete len:410 (-),score=82.34 TRINITY_DN6824_c0_g2_i1:108-1238(-)
MASKLGSPAKPLEAPETLPPWDLPDDTKMEEYSVPDLAELHLDPNQITTSHRGGESQGLFRMAEYLKNEKAVRKFQKPETNPASFDPPATTVLSPYLKFGCLSSRLFYHMLKEVYQKNPKEVSKPPVSLEGQLLWREFFYSCGAHIPNFDKMTGSSVCKQIPWRTDDSASNDFKAWADARTGYPWIDAIMTQLRQEGWIHHLARHSVACFLTRGDLFVHWEWGLKEFEKQLLDADWSINAGNWLWLSASAFFHQFYRVYSPVAFGKKWDPSGEYIRKYLPVLSKMPAEYIYEPWTAPKNIQKQVGCVVGHDYPNRICIHEDVMKINLEKMKKAYSDGKDSQSSSSSSSKKATSKSSRKSASSRETAMPPGAKRRKT